MICSTDQYAYPLVCCTKRNHWQIHIFRLPRPQNSSTVIGFPGIPDFPAPSGITIDCCVLSIPYVPQPNRLQFSTVTLWKVRIFRTLASHSPFSSSCPRTSPCDFRLRQCWKIVGTGFQNNVGIVPDFVPIFLFSALFLFLCFFEISKIHFIKLLYK